jgi:hypothetical protein
MEKSENSADVKKQWVKPEVESELIYETQALGCGQCLSARVPVTYYGGPCTQNVSNY